MSLVISSFSVLVNAAIDTIDMLLLLVLLLNICCSFAIAMVLFVATNLTIVECCCCWFLFRFGHLLILNLCYCSYVSLVYGLSSPSLSLMFVNVVINVCCCYLCNILLLLLLICK